MNDAIGTIYTDLSYGNQRSNTFDLYVPNSSSKSYGLVVYLHAGGFTGGDKSDDKDILTWFCSKGYVAAGINYTLRSEENRQVNVYSQSLEIQRAIPFVVKEASKLGYPIDQMAIAGGSAGGTLAMLYAYRDAKDAPVPVKLLFEAVGPSSFYVEDWDIYGLDQNPQSAVGLLSVMSGTTLTVDMIQDGSYLEKVKPISPIMWVDEKTVPSVMIYGKHDKVQPFKGAQRLIQAYQKYDVDHVYFECEHSGHGLQNDDAIYHTYLKTVEKYLNQYMPVMS